MIIDLPLLCELLFITTLLFLVFHPNFHDSYSESKVMELAMKNSNATYQTYSSEKLGLSIDYPDNWNIVEEKADHSWGRAIFMSPDSYANILIGTITVSGSGDPKLGIALDKFHQLIIEDINNENSTISYLNKDSSLSGKPAIRIEYNTGLSEKIPIHSEIIYTMKENTNEVYYIKFTAPFNNAFSYFPIFRHMHQSLEISESQPEINFKKYINHDSGFSFDYPSSWKIEDLSSEVQSDGNFINLESPDNMAVINVITYFNEYPEQSYNTLQQMAIDDFVSDNLDYSLNNDFSFLRDNPASEIYAHDSKDDTTKIHILSFDDSRVYEILYHATSMGYYKHRNVLDDIVDSFQSFPILIDKHDKPQSHGNSLQQMNDNIQMNRFWQDQHTQQWSNLWSNMP